MLSLLPEGFADAPHRSTDAQVLMVLEGEGESEIGTDRIGWRTGDILTVPNWSWTRHRATRQAVIFAFSNIAPQQRLGLWWADTIVREDP